MRYHLDRLDGTLTKIANETFPTYRGKKFTLSTDIPKQLASYWDGGSRDSFAFYNMQTGQAQAVHSNHPMFEPNQPSQLRELPSHIILVEHSILCGKDAGLTFYARTETLTPMIPTKVEVTPDQQIVLRFTASLKSSYGGVSNLRFVEAKRETGISADRWEAAKTACINTGLLNKAGAITPAGRNAIGR
jgi:hypothetical protein